MMSALRQRQRPILFSLWLMILLSFWLYTRQQEMGVAEMMSSSIRFTQNSAWGPLILFLLFMLRPLLLLPTTILTLAAGFLFGAFLGFVYAFIAILASTLIAYAIAYYFGDNQKNNAPSTGLMSRLRERSFETVLLSRFLFLPGDLINYAAGFFKIHLGAFMLATAIGGIPGLLMVVLAGAAIEGEFTTTGIRINVWFLIASAALLITSLLIAYFLRKRGVLTASNS